LVKFWSNQEIIYDYRAEIQGIRIPFNRWC